MLCLVFFFFAGVKGLLFLACFVRSRIKVKWLLNCFQLCSNAVLHLPCAKMLVALCESDGECSSRVILKVVDTVEAFEQTVPSLNRFRSVLPLYAKKKKKNSRYGCLVGLNCVLPRCVSCGDDCLKLNVQEATSHVIAH
jgi:hypothetical protein